jgi:zinc metalloprotease ZmpB
MYQEFDRANKVHVNRDDKGVARELLHTDEQVVSQAPTAQLAAKDYLTRYGRVLGMGSDETANLALAPQPDATDAGAELRFQNEKRSFDTTTVVYRQTHFGLPVWHGGVAIHMKEKPYRVVSSQSTRHPDLDVKRPAANVLARLKRIDADTLRKQLGLSDSDKQFDAATLKIERVKLIIYRYEAAKRARMDAHAHDTNGFVHFHPTLPLPAVAAGVDEGRHYVSAEIHFALALREQQQPIHWIAIVEAESLSVLYLRAFVDSVQGQVFMDDPMTTNGGPLPNAAAASLDVVRTSVTLQGLAPGTPQQLSGNIVRLLDLELPTPVAPPTEPSGTDFNFSSRTNNFAAVNAYYHCDRFFRLMEDLGFNLSTFFGAGTAFPSKVDHRGFGTAASPSGNVVNAHCLGTSGGLGILQTTFALADTTDTVNPIGIACDYRVVLHELGGHGVLYPHVHSPNFGFSHSAGDSVAAITCDPETHATDRFLTFPWVSSVIARRHDRTPAAGWGWGGNIATHPFDPVIDGGGYNNEQILSSTMFRFYRSIGGDSTSLPMRQFASNYAVYLILRAISTLAPATNPSNAAGFATALITADSFDWTTTGQTGGAYGKVIRWAFEKQGLYQPPGTPTPNNNVGAPPPVDVYIDDGRHGEYQYQPVHWDCQDIWNRRHNDGGTTHEEPIIGQTNFAYVKIKNRGSQVATGVVIKAFHANPAAGLVYPNDWHPMTTTQLSTANVPANNTGVVTVGPFEWTPTAIGHECMFMVASAAGDASNINNLSAGESIPEWRLVPNDNNIGQRNVFPVAGGGGLKGLLASLDGAKILIKNPHNVAAKTVVQAVLPAFLTKAGWTAVFDNPGAGAFALKAGEAKAVVLRLRPGKEFTPEDVAKAKDSVIRVEASANGIPVGGMTYTLDPKMKAPAGNTGVAAAPAKHRAAKKSGAKNTARGKTAGK